MFKRPIHGKEVAMELKVLITNNKTKLNDYLASCISDLGSIVVIEDVLKLNLKNKYPEKDVFTIQITDNFTLVDALKEAINLKPDTLLITESSKRKINIWTVSQTVRELVPKYYIEIKEV